MEFLNQAVAQVRELFGSMTPASRIMTSLLVAVVAISLVYLVNYQVAGSDQYLMGGEMFSRGQLSRMQAALGEAGLEYDMDGAQIKIPRGRGHEYMAALGKAGALPVVPFGTYMQNALDQGGSFETKQQKAERIKLAKEQELAAIIQKMEGVEEAAVLYSISEQRGLNPKTTATALVSITPLTSGTFGAIQVSHLRTMVAGAYDALRPENVTVNIGGRTYAGGGKDGMGSAIDDPAVSRKEHYERDRAQKIRHALSYIDNLVVEVNAELDSTIRRRETITKHDPQTIPIQTSIRTSTKEKGQETAGGRPGRQPNTPTANSAAQVAARGGVQNTTKESNEQETNYSVVNKTTTSTDYHGYTVRSAKATITVPRSYFVQVWQDQNKNNPADPDADDAKAAMPTAEELSQVITQITEGIEKAVLPLLPSEAGSDNRPNVTVVTLWDLPAEEIEKPSFGTIALAWTGRNWSTVSMMALALFSFAALRSMVKSVPVAEVSGPDSSALTPPELSVVQDDEEHEDEPARPKRKFVKGPSVKEDLAGMVREDPDAAASILRSWISNAG